MTITELRAKIGSEVTGDPFFKGTPEAYRDELTDAQRITVTNRMADYIRKNPTQFSTAQVAVANRQKDISAPVDYTFGDKVSDFFGEVANQAEDINPLSQKNRGKTAAALLISAVVLGAVFIYVNRVPVKAK